jgi:hypothetical protein
VIPGAEYQAISTEIRIHRMIGFVEDFGCGATVDQESHQAGMYSESSWLCLKKSVRRIKRSGILFILTRFQPGDCDQSNFSLTVSTVSGAIKKPLKRLGIPFDRAVTRLKPGENEMACQHTWCRKATSIA